MRWLFQTHPLDYVELRDRLRECLDGFQDIGNREFPEGDRWAVEMEYAGERATVPFVELSDGQRVLILLHAILISARRSPGLIILDEPESFVALREIEPWLSLLEETAEAGPAQFIVLSHHPEYLNRLMDKAILFKRQSNGWPKAERLDRDKLPSLPLAELVARGWEDA
jgi:predicted ATPase